MSTPEIIIGIDLKLAHVRIELNWNIFDSYREDDDSNYNHPHYHSNRAIMDNDNSYIGKFD